MIITEIIGITETLRLPIQLVSKLGFGVSQSPRPNFEVNWVYLKTYKLDR